MFSTTAQTSRNVELSKDHILKAAALKGLKNYHRIPQRPPIFALKGCYTTGHLHITIIVTES
jgi:hypothetical protein